MAHAPANASVGRSLTPAFLLGAFLLGAGLIAAATALFRIVIETRAVAIAPFASYLEFLMLAVPAVGLVYAGYWLWVGEYHPNDVWRIGTFAVGGAVVATAATAGVLVFRSPPTMDATATFVLFVGTGTEGSLLGVLIGAFAARNRLFRRERTLTDEYETLHALLRHDLRNRLTIIGGHLTLLAEAADAPAESVATIETQLDAVEALLDDTRLATEAIRTEAPLEAVDLVPLVRQQLQLLTESYDAVSVDADLPDEAFVAADDLLASVLDNLLSNAVGHNDRSMPGIQVSVDVTNEHVRLAVADDGPGIPPGRRSQVFEAGVGEGTGMGLYLVETVVDRYGGSVAIDDNEPRGTVVTVTLPRVHA